MSLVSVCVRTAQKSKPGIVADADRSKRTIGYAMEISEGARSTLYSIHARPECALIARRHGNQNATDVAMNTAENYSW